MGKLVYVIIDGLGDEPVSLLKDKTPLEAAETPNLDYFAQKGALGLVQNFRIDHKEFIAENGSNFGGISLLGQNPRDTNWKRGPLESLGAGVNFREGKDLAIRCNLAFVNLKGEVENRRAGRISNEDGHTIIEEIKEKIKYSGDFELKHTLRHRAVLILKSSQPLGEEIRGSDPIEEGEHMRHVLPTNRAEENVRSANMLRSFEERAHEVLRQSKSNNDRRSKAGYPVTHLITRGAGTKLPELPVYDNVAAICTSPVEFGLAKAAGMTILGIENVTEEYEKDIEKTVALLKDQWGAHEKFVIFIKGPDTYGHEGNSMKKKNCIEYLDKTLFAFLKTQLSAQSDVLCVTSDHATPTKLMRHAAEPIPLLICGKIKPDTMSNFAEKYCERGSLGLIQGYDVIKKLYQLYRQ
ncbi:hypothetical protein COT72_03085 [archaeon CG10_big_fil_rev_8_21_14_0_10_43_11]|nr:MAG: hypothetical protein COT72_03085 [archaeon CG10_big_fil_rev_8_21_14_0_10_43_11]